MARYLHRSISIRSDNHQYTFICLSLVMSKFEKSSRTQKMRSRIEYTTINSLVKAASYAVRGPIVTRSLEITEQLKKTGHGLPFDSVIACNIGNPQALQQKPITFFRDVLSCVVNPSLIEKGIFPKDVCDRANNYLKAVPSLGSYTDSQGIKLVRDEICQFMEERDGYKADPKNIYLTNGASEGVRQCMQLLMRGSNSGFKDGVLTPIPQYPLYSALSTLLEGSLVPYCLDESNGWSCDSAMLTDALNAANEDDITVRALVVINPGNPTGQVLTEDKMRDIISFCIKEDICLMADEVYQENVYKEGAKFLSFRKVAMDMDAFDGDQGLQMVSFHSISKGFIGECGFRGGYFEMLGYPQEVMDEVKKLASISLCSNTLGQVAMGLMVQPPTPGQESYEQYHNEKMAILDSMKRRANMLSVALNQFSGMTCNAIEGAMYAFPSINLPEKACAAAREKGMEPDAMYCSELLEHTGIVVVPGSGFGQVEGTYHFRTTLLPPEDKIHTVVERLGHFHNDFMARYK